MLDAHDSTDCDCTELPASHYVVMNPTWKWAVEVHAAALQQSARTLADRARIKRTIEFMHEMAAHLDRHNAQ
jgi:hypothetical protein